MADKKIKDIIENIEKAIRGKKHIVELSLVPLISEGHLLLQDVPGVGKSTLAEAIARSIGGTFKRIQFTSDLLPSDVLGVNIFNRAKNTFEFKKGPIFANIVLADEINRASPKTQSALLEAMSEKNVTIDGITYKLPIPFLVIATENPLEFAGTYPLPESELDRFMMSLSIGYPDETTEKEIMLKGEKREVENIKPVADINDVLYLTKLTKEVFVDQSILNYMIKIVKKTRENEFIKIGISTRGSIEFVNAVKGYAIIKGRNYVIPDDVKYIAPFVLSHRIVAKDGNREFKKEIVLEIINEIEVPL